MLVVLLALSALFFAITIVKMTQRHEDRSNRTIGIALAGIVVGMVGVSFASMPLYRLFCAVTGYARHAADRRGRGARRGAAGHHRAVQRQHQSEPAVDLRAEQREMRVPLGDEHLAFYTARNDAGTPVTGIALYNVTPDNAGNISTRRPASASTSRRWRPVSRCSSR